MERANLFKRKKIAFVSKEARLGRALEVQQERNDKRAQQFNQVRAVPDVQEGKFQFSFILKNNFFF